MKVKSQQENKPIKAKPHNTVSQPKILPNSQVTRSDVANLLFLQKSLGNQHIQRMLAIQTKSNSLSEVDDEVEQTINRKRGGGQSLDRKVRSQMETAMNADFRGVRVHADHEADHLNQRLNSRAFTTGQDIFFGAGNYNPGSSIGRELIAHELTHVVQQNGVLHTKMKLGAPQDEYEQEADRVARYVLQQEQEEDSPSSIKEQPARQEDKETDIKIQNSNILERQKLFKNENESLRTRIDPNSRINYSESKNIRQNGGARRVEITEPTQVIGHVTVLGQDISGVNVARFIDHEILDELERGWDALVMNYLGGISNFETYMQFPPNAEARADYLKASLKFAGEQLLNAAVTQIKDRIPGFDIAVGFVRAMAAEHDRAAQAARRVNIRDYIVGYRTNILQMNTGFKQQIGRLDDGIQREFQRRVTTAPADLAQPGRTAEEQPRRAISGPGAEYLNSLHHAVTQWNNNIPGDMMFLQRILERWVRTREGSVESRGGGDVYMGGRIYLKVIMRKEGNNWSISERPSKGKLAAPEVDRTIDALERVMREQGKTINDLDIKKVLTIEVEDEVFGFNDYYRVHLHYRRPNSIIYNSGGIPSPVTSETVRKSAAIADEAVRRVDRYSLGLTDLEVY